MRKTEEISEMVDKLQDKIKEYSDIGLYTGDLIEYRSQLQEALLGKMPPKGREMALWLENEEGSYSALYEL